MITNLNNFVNESLGSFLALPANGLGGSRATFFWWRILLCKIRNSETKKERFKNPPAFLPRPFLRAGRKPRQPLSISLNVKLGGEGGIPFDFAQDKLLIFPIIMIRLAHQMMSFSNHGGVFWLMFELFLSKTPTKEASPATARQARHTAEKYSFH